MSVEHDKIIETKFGITDVGYIEDEDGSRMYFFNNEPSDCEMFATGDNPCIYARIFEHGEMGEYTVEIGEAESWAKVCIEFNEDRAGLDRLEKDLVERAFGREKTRWIFYMLNYIIDNYIERE